MGHAQAHRKGHRAGSKATRKAIDRKQRRQNKIHLAGKGKRPKKHKVPKKHSQKPPKQSPVLRGFKDIGLGELFWKGG